ncbi:hypothetical protein SEA_BRAYBEAST_49 [Arthrobacter phage BrayBeast]
MTAVSDRLDAIQKRLDTATPGAISITPSDVAWLRETARKQQAAIDAVRELHAPRDFDPVTDGVYFGQTNMDYQICHHDEELYPCTTIRRLEAKP